MIPGHASAVAVKVAIAATLAVQGVLSLLEKVTAQVAGLLRLVNYLLCPRHPLKIVNVVDLALFVRELGNSL